MSVRVKLLFALAPLGIALLALGVLSVATIQTLGQSSARILQENYLTTLAIQRVLDAIEDLDAAASLTTLEHGSGIDDATRAEIDQDRARLAAALRVQEGNITEPGEDEVTARLRAGWEAYDRALASLLATAGETGRERVFADAMRPAYRQVRESANRILALNQDAMVVKGDRTQRVVRRMNTVLVTSAIAAFAIGLILSLTLLSRVLRRLEDLALAVERIGEKDFQTRVAESGADEIAQLARSFNRMASHLEEYRRSSLGELLQAQQAAQAAIDSIPDPVLVFAAEGVLISANQSAERTLGLEEAGGVSAVARLEPGLRASIDEARAHVLGGHGPFSPKSLDDAVRVPTREGDAYLLPRATPVYSADGSIAAATVILQDVTRLRRFGELTSDLVATAAHELRTPLTSLRMAIHLCIEEKAGPISIKQADLLYAAREDCERLHETVNELLELARLQGRRETSHRRPIDLATLAAETCARLQGIAAERGVRIETDLPPFLPRVEAEPDRIEVVLTNLLDNALKHAPPESVIGVRASESGGRVRVEVRDSGPGIPAAERARIFERFYRLPTAPAGGTGLGLSIAREIVLAHGGEIGVEPRLDPATGEESGATFWLTLPAAPDAEDPAGARHPG